MTSINLLDYSKPHLVTIPFTPEVELNLSTGIALHCKTGHVLHRLFGRSFLHLLLPANNTKCTNLYHTKKFRKYGTLDLP